MQDTRKQLKSNCYIKRSIRIFITQLKSCHLKTQMNKMLQIFFCFDSSCTITFFGFTCRLLETAPRQRYNVLQNKSLHDFMYFHWDFRIFIINKKNNTLKMKICHLTEQGKTTERVSQLLNLLLKRRISDLKTVQPLQGLFSVNLHFCVKHLGLRKERNK